MDRIDFAIKPCSMLIIFMFGCLAGKCAEYLAAQMTGKRLEKRINMRAEIVSGTTACFLIYRFGISVMSMRGILLGIVLLTAALTDLECGRIPDRIHVMGILIFGITAFFLPHTVKRLICGLGYTLMLSGGMLFLSLLFECMTGKENLGGGDVKLFFTVGLYFESVWEILFFLIFSCIFGLMTAWIRRTERIPFAPSIAAASMLMIICGKSMTDWYTGWFR